MTRFEDLVWQQQLEGVKGYEYTVYACDVEGYRATIRREAKDATVPIRGFAGGPLITVTLQRARYVVFPLARVADKAALMTASGWAFDLEAAKRAAFGIGAARSLDDFTGLLDESPTIAHS